MADHDVLVSPVTPDPAKNAGSGIALCLSGGGYRAMLFHLGTLWRLNSDGILPKLARISSVSGGSITSGMLGAAWSRLQFGPNGTATNFEAEVVKPLRKMASTHIFDRNSPLGAIRDLIAGLINHDQVVDAYQRTLFHGATLQDLPGDATNDFTPRFVFNATNLHSGSLWRFSKPYMADWRVGMIRNPTTPLAVAVAASSAFPMGLPPVKLEFKPDTVIPLDGATLHTEPYTKEAILVDGGVYDNLGIETAWKEHRMVLISDAGGVIAEDDHLLFDGRDAGRVFDIIYNQVASLRKRQVIRAYQLEPGAEEHRDGAYWGVGSNIASYGLPVEEHLPCPFPQTTKLAAVGTVLQPLDDATQERLINWGFAICDVAIRKHCAAPFLNRGIALTSAGAFPYPAAGV